MVRIELTYWQQATLLFKYFVGFIFVRSFIYLNSQIHPERIDVEIETVGPLLRLGLSAWGFRLGNDVASGCGIVSRQ